MILNKAAFHFLSHSPENVLYLLKFYCNGHDNKNKKDISKTGNGKLHKNA